MRPVMMVEPTPGLRGPGRTLLAFATHLAPRTSVVVAVPDGELPEEIRARLPNIGLVPLPLYRSRVASWVRGTRAIFAAAGAPPGLRLIHANGLSALNLVASAARVRGVPVLVHFHASEMTLRSRVYLRVWRRLGVRMAFLPVSGYSRALLDASPARDLVRGILPNPIDVSAFASPRALPERPFRVGFMGSKRPNKGLHRLVEVADRLRHEGIEWRVYGIDLQRNDTPYVRRCRAELDRRGLDGRVVWRGRVSDPATAYREMDVLLVPSERESFSRVTLEAMAGGVPVVASRVGGIGEILTDGVSGFLFDPRLPGEAADHIARLMHDADLWRACSAAAVRAAGAFDISILGARLERFYEEVAGEADPGARLGSPAGADGTVEAQR